MKQTTKQVFKETTAITIVTTVISLAVVFGVITAKADSDKFDNKIQNEQELLLNFYKESNEYKRELIEYQFKALEKADNIIKNNNLYDIDGSDDMSEYLELKEQINDILEEEM